MQSLAKAIAAGLFAVVLASGAASKPLISAEAWNAYKENFLDTSGRIIDTGNGNISHSEGQGYGLLLAYYADSPPDFEQIWSFTRTELLVRDDGLAVWRWDPSKRPHVTDINNATDGDILIAYALALAGARWNRDDYTAAASRIATALASKAVVAHGERLLLLPAVTGFAAADRPDGPVINPSYYIFEAFPLLAQLAPQADWTKLSGDGLALVEKMQFGPRQLPTDWVSLAGEMRPADGFPGEYGYNALRIPLYLARAGNPAPALVQRLRKQTTGPEDSLQLMTFDDAGPGTLLTDPGYRFINHLVACVAEAKPIPEDLRQFRPTLYYPSTLHLLGLAYAAEKHPGCL
ncbi:glycosyl hydrolase family 8 [Rhizobiaceae bacterium n13]|uniref:cellulase n=1 Tax=Ferirhizobium litorale TaxID=2927786 RepID=A0AAE3U0Z9_9HYPH|nr:glycosyl hydrolase family 8 [Fererhizobium litorale]MDI7862113.1 glycosyl hydrolase family 8 [Fererhizobium litorale]MDI7922614.1 glycosyl hydrolase family 8 [Fererhizobium litorale]